MTIRFFKTPADFQKWLEANHAKTQELWVGFYKKDSGKPSITWPQSVDEALCYGWIDGIRKSIDELSYKIRFTPRKPQSNWSAINIKRVAELTKEGRMRPAGLKAYEFRKEYRSGIYAYEQRPQDMPEPYAGILAKNRAAARFFESCPPYYRKLVTWRILTGKKEETRLKRLQELIDYSAKGERLPGAVPSKKTK